jgi:hypothetical protein
MYPSAHIQIVQTSTRPGVTPARTFLLVIPLNKDVDCGEWWLRPDAKLLDKALRAALDTQARPLAERVVDLLPFEGRTHRRLLELVDGELSPAQVASRLDPKNQEWLASERGASVHAVELQHSFNWQSGS